MKNLGLFIFVIGAVLVVIMSGCSQSASTSASVNTMIAKTVKATPSPVPTMIDPTVKSDQDRRKSMEDHKKEWVRINDPKKIFMADVKMAAVCKNREKYQELSWFFQNFPESKSESDKLSFKLSDIGIAGSDVKKQLETAARGYLKDMTEVVKSGASVEECGNGEGGLVLTNRFAVAQQIEYLVTDPDLIHLKLMLADGLRQVYLTAVKQSIMDIKFGKEVDAHMVGKTIEEFGFSLKELDTTQAELDAITVE